MSTQGEIDDLRDLCHKLGEENRRVKEATQKALSYIKLIESNQSELTLVEKAFVDMVRGYLEEGYE